MAVRSPAATDTPRPPGSDTVFTFGTYKGQTFEHVLLNHNSYCVWAAEQTQPSQYLQRFVTWWTAHYDIQPVSYTL